MAKTGLIKCTCKSECQDEKYGKHIRLANLKGDVKNTDGKAHCTVCGKESFIIQNRKV